jgi:hypothetical protein
LLFDFVATTTHACSRRVLLLMQGVCQYENAAFAGKSKKLPAQRLHIDSVLCRNCALVELSHFHFLRFV